MGQVLYSQEAIPRMSVPYQAQSIQTESPEVALILVAWEMTRYTFNNRQAVKADDVRAEYEKKLRRAQTGGCGTIQSLANLASRRSGQRDKTR